MDIRANEAQGTTEIVTFRGVEEKDADGRLIPGTGAKALACRVYPAGQSEINDTDFDGNTDDLTVLAPGGSLIEVGMTAEIRGEVYDVKFVPFDYSIARKPAHPKHRPKVTVTVSRAEAE